MDHQHDRHEPMTHSSEAKTAPTHNHAHQTAMTDAHKQSAVTSPDTAQAITIHGAEYSAHAAHNEHMRHVAHTGEHGGHNGHAGHSEEMFKRPFWISLALTIPTLYYAHLFQELLGYTAPAFPGSQYLGLVLGSVIYWYGGWVFLTGAVSEIRGRAPGMMTLVALAITTAYAYSVAITLGLVQGMDFYWELATLVTIMLLGHWMEMRAVGSAQSALNELAKLLPDQALVNVVLNGVQATPSGGKVCVRAYPAPDEPDTQKWVMLSVNDTGSGIAPMDLSRIFDPFFTTRADGTGLGLSVVQQIVQEHGGRINVESEPGHGTRLVLQLPVKVRG